MHKNLRRLAKNRDAMYVYANIGHKYAEGSG
jgi:hypothetical protein